MKYQTCSTARSG